MIPTPDDQRRTLGADFPPRISTTGESFQRSKRKRFPWWIPAVVVSVIIGTWSLMTWLGPTSSSAPNIEPLSNKPLNNEPRTVVEPQVHSNLDNLATSPSESSANTASRPRPETIPADSTPPDLRAPVARPTLDPTRFNTGTSLAIELIRSGKIDQASAALASLQHLAQDPSAKECVAGLVALTHYLGEFEKGYLQGRNRLEGGTELVVAGKRIISRGREPDRLLFRSEGKNLTFAEASVPWPLRLAIADLWLDPQDPASALAKSAFFSIGPARSAERAEESWQAAERLGGGDQIPALRRAFAELE